MMFGLLSNSQLSRSKAETIVKRYGAVLEMGGEGTRSVSELSDPKELIEKALLVLLELEQTTAGGDALAAAYLNLSRFQEMSQEEANHVRAFHLLKGMAASASQEALEKMVPAISSVAEVASRFNQLERAELDEKKRVIGPFAHKLGFQNANS